MNIIPLGLAYATCIGAFWASDEYQLTRSLRSALRHFLGGFAIASATGVLLYLSALAIWVD